MSRYIAAVAIGVLGAAVTMASCKKDDDDIPPMPSAAPAQSAAPVELLPEDDAGLDAEDEADAKKSGGPGVTRLVSCCRVLAQNAQSQPDPFLKGSMIQAASVCEGSARSGNYQAVNQLLMQYSIPCK